MSSYLASAINTESNDSILGKRPTENSFSQDHKAHFSIQDHVLSQTTKETDGGHIDKAVRKRDEKFFDKLAVTRSEPLNIT